MDRATQARLEAVEQRMELWEARFDAAVTSLSEQISQFRDEVHLKLSAIRETIRTGDELVRTDLRGALAATEKTLRTDLKEAIHTTEETLRADLKDAIHTTEATLRAELRDVTHTTEETLRSEIRSGDEETRRYMRVLNEDLVERIARLGEGR